MPRCPASLLSALIFLVMLTLTAGNLSAQTHTLRVYGPGGPQAPMEECARIFSQRRGVEINVTAGPEARWLEQAKADADLIFGGAEYMLTDFMQRHPDLLNAGTRTSLWERPAGILVRKGNPKRLRTLKDLTRPDVKLLDVNGAGQVGLWEDLAGQRHLIGLIQRNIAVSVKTTAEAIDKWKTMPELDAWITFESWHHRLQDQTDLVRVFKPLRLYRGTPIAITTRTKHWDLAQDFIRFLKSPEGHAIFQKWGWK